MFAGDTDSVPSRDLNKVRKEASRGVPRTPQPFEPHNESGMGYQCVATSRAGFLQQLAVAYVTHGYFYYVAGRVPEGKDPGDVDRKLLAKYGIERSRWSRARRKRGGHANMHYLRYGRFFVLLATQGAHEFFEEERGSIRDFRRDSLHFAGYSVGYKLGRDGKGHVSVRIHPKSYRDLKAHFLELATSRSVEKLTQEFRTIPFEPYAPVRNQVLAILRAVNRARKMAGFGPVPLEALRLRRRTLKPFEPWEDQVGEAA